MPSALTTIPEDVANKLQGLESEYLGGDVSKSGYCSRKWQLLKPHVEKEIVSQVEKLQLSLQINLNEDDYCSKMINILQSADFSKTKSMSDSESSLDEREIEVEIDPSITSPEARQIAARLLRQSTTLKRAVTATKEETENLEMSKCKISSGSEGERDQSDEEMRPLKKRRQTVESQEGSEVEMKSVTITPVRKKCPFCRESLENQELKSFDDQPANAKEELIALTHSSLSLFNGEEESVNELDQRPTNKITQFAIYDKEGHLCPIDGGLIENDVHLYMSGYLKAVYDEDSSPESGVPTKEIGPINEWWYIGFEEGEQVLICVATPYGEYYLMEPHKLYIPYMMGIWEKINLTKIVNEFLTETQNPSYEDLLYKLEVTLPFPGLPRLTEDSLLRHAQFICEQIANIDDPGESERSLILTPCMQTLIDLAGVSFEQRKQIRRMVQRKIRVDKKEFTKAAVTPLVQEVFEKFFPDHIESNLETKDETKRKRSCTGECQSDCQSCSSTDQDQGRRNRCSNADDSDEEIICVDSAPPPSTKHPKAEEVRRQCDVVWVGPQITATESRLYYGRARVDDVEVEIGCYVCVKPFNPSDPTLIGRLAYMWENKQGQKYMHAHWMCRSSQTVLMETGDPRELFLVDECENALLSGVLSTVRVVRKITKEDWRWEGGIPSSKTSSDLERTMPNDGKNFFFQKSYDEMSGRFEDPPPDPLNESDEASYKYCPSCERARLRKHFNTPYVEERLGCLDSAREVEYAVVKWRGEEYRAGACVYLKPSVFNFKSFPSIPREPNKSRLETVDDELYPEFYRKALSENLKVPNVTPEPFCVGLIKSIIVCSDLDETSSDICLIVHKFYRPENTMGILNDVQQKDLNFLYCSTEEIAADFSDVLGQCYVVYSDNLFTDAFSWSLEGPDRFYFSDSYDNQTQTLSEPASVFKQLGDPGKGKGKGKQKIEKKKVTPETWPYLSKPLDCLDVFAGCGGLSEGLHRSGVAITRWAIESDENAALAFRYNNRHSSVFNTDCNHFLKLVMSGHFRDENGLKLPQKGDVELLVGGPPCQGFSGMNRFNSRQYSLFKNSLIVSFLSYCDFYRPRYFILENVRHFFIFKKSAVLKLTIRCLIKMGYQVTFGILQAGNFGVPQNRRRAIIIAAAPGETLPILPEPMHAFGNCRSGNISVFVEGKRFDQRYRFPESAPLRPITVRDAMSDLPEIPNGYYAEEMNYGGDPISHFQRKLRGEEKEVLRDHICKEMAPIVEARISHIPTAPGSDWRDLPNIVVRLSDGTFTKKLVYTHHDKKNGKSKRGTPRGVCSCANERPCNPLDRQFNTLIPWCLPHTGNRNNNWVGLYGRLDWEGFFSTTVTNPEPMSKQGRVLHPVQPRVVSVRECARSQGFPDRYKFCGTIPDKHRQIGNAVPPPMGFALGVQLRRAVSSVDRLYLDGDLKMSID